MSTNVYLRYNFDHNRYKDKVHHPMMMRKNVGHSNMQMRLLIGDPWVGSKTTVGGKNHKINRPHNMGPIFFLKPQGRRPPRFSSPPKMDSLGINLPLCDLETTQEVEQRGFARQSIIFPISSLRCC